MASVINNKEIDSTIELRDGRKLHTTDNGFTYYVESKKGKIEQITEAYFNKAKQLRITKKKK